MKIRLTGTKEETKAFAEHLDAKYEVVSISEFYPNTRKNLKSKEGRVYVDVGFEYVDKRGRHKLI